METMNIALKKAQEISKDWKILATTSGGWSLQMIGNGGAIINYMKNPCKANLGRVGHPYQVNCKTIENFKSLDEALQFIQQVKGSKIGK